jgi:hypothetical protein
MKPKIEEYFADDEEKRLMDIVRNMKPEKREIFLKNIGNLYLRETDDFCPHIKNCDYGSDIKYCKDYKDCAMYELLEGGQDGGD